MSTENINIKALRALILSGESKDPLVFLESVMSGQDPRKQSEVYKLVEGFSEVIDLFGDNTLSYQWDELISEIEDNCQYDPVSLKMSIDAGKSLAEYVHSKRKSIDVNTSLKSQEVTPLTEAEIEMFEAKFDHSY